jgi:hypothetical protein
VGCWRLFEWSSVRCCQVIVADCVTGGMVVVSRGVMCDFVYLCLGSQWAAGTVDGRPK